METQQLVLTLVPSFTWVELGHPQMEVLTLLLDDLIGRISFQGADGSELIEAAAIGVDVDGTPGANDMPGRIEFHTTSDGSPGAIERMRIDQMATSVSEIQTPAAGARPPLVLTPILKLDLFCQMLVLVQVLVSILEQALLAASLLQALLPPITLLLTTA